MMENDNVTVAKICAAHNTVEAFGTATDAQLNAKAREVYEAACAYLISQFGPAKEYA